MTADDLSSITDSHCGGGGDSLWGTNATACVVPPLQGRGREKLELLKAYQRVLQTQESQVAFVHGTSGQGKTSLVDTLREPVCTSNGYFCAGKFFQDSATQEPYSAITAAFSDLCDLVVQSPDFDEQAQTRIQKKMAGDGHLLSRSISLTRLFTGLDSMHDLQSCENSLEKKTVTFAMFRAACKTFLLAMPTRKHPIVLFLDDVQWMDDGSAKLIEMFVNDKDIKNVMFIISYRDEEASTVEEGILHSSQREGIIDVQLSNLDLSSVRQMLVWNFGLSTNALEELSELTLQRTGGNPFFVSLFLEELSTKASRTGNAFDVDKIRSSTMLCRTLADLLSQKVCRLPAEVRDVLKAASLLGYSFDEQVLCEVPGVVVKITPEAESGNYRIREEVLSCLAHAADVGFIERMKGGFKFTHDKLQTTFLDLINQPSTENLHLRIGQTYLTRNSDNSIYNAVVHLNVAPGFLHDKEQWIKLARLNLVASQYCQRISAFDKAISLLRKGIELLDSIGMKWSQDVFELSLELTEALAKATLLVGDFDSCFGATKEAMVHVDTKERKIRIMCIEVECRMANNDMSGTIKASVDALSELGVKLPRRTGMRHVVFKVMKLKMKMSGKTDNDILGLPVVEDASMTIAIRLLRHLAFYAILMNEEKMGVYAALHAMDLAFQHELSTYAATAFSLFAVAIVRMGDVKRAYHLGNLALKMMEQCPSREADCSSIGFVNTLLRHWKEPLCNLREPLFEAASAGFDRGDLTYSVYCLSQGVGMSLIGGTHLGVLEKALRGHYNRIHDLGQDELLLWIRPYMQCVANLRSSSTDWDQLALMSGEYMNFKMYLGDANASKNILVTATALMTQVTLANAFGFHHMARETFEELESLGRVIRSSYAFTIWCWGAGVTYYESFRTDGKRQYLRKARYFTKLLQHRDALGPNASTFLKHLNFMEALLRRSRTNARQRDASYDDETLRILDRRLESFPCEPRYVYVRAFTDAGSIAQRMGRFVESDRYFQRAQTIASEDYGSIAPVAWLAAKREADRRKYKGNDIYSSSSNELVGGIVQVHE